MNTPIGTRLYKTARINLLQYMRSLQKEKQNNNNKLKLESTIKTTRLTVLYALKLYHHAFRVKLVNQRSVIDMNKSTQVCVNRTTTKKTNVIYELGHNDNQLMMF